MQTAAIIINEAHLGDRLGRAIETGRRGEFGLLLALLSEDAREFAEFVIKGSEPLDKQLARHFEIPPGQHCRAMPGSDAGIDNSKSYRQGCLTDFRLQQALKPEPLVLGSTLGEALQDALENSSVHARQRREGLDVSLPSPMHFNDVLEAQRSISKRMVSVDVAA